MRTSEQQAICTEATDRLADLRRVALVLWPDRDDPAVLSELVTVLAEMRHAERAIRASAS